MQKESWPGEGRAGSDWVLVQTPDIDGNEWEQLTQKVRQRLSLQDSLWVMELSEETTLRPEAGKVAVAGSRLAEWMEKEQPDVVLFPATPFGKQVAAYAAGRAGVGLTADLTDFYMDEAGRLHQLRMAYGGSLQAEIVCDTPRLQMATVKVRREESAVVVAGGLGMDREGFAALRQLAQVLGGTLGATRAAVDAGLAPFAAQIGQSGAYVRPPIYFAFGISGAVQHLAGMKESGIVVAVNTDRKAPIFDYADYAICADARRTAERMIEILRNESK